MLTTSLRSRISGALPCEAVIIATSPSCTNLVWNPLPGRVFTSTIRRRKSTVSSQCCVTSRNSLAADIFDNERTQHWHCPRSADFPVRSKSRSKSSPRTRPLPTTEYQLSTYRQMTEIAEQIGPQSTMGEVLEAYPGAQRALFRKYHIGGCSSCAFSPAETLEQVCGRNG